MNGARTRVLIVDDDASFAGLVAEVLGAKGYDAVRASGPGEALALAEKGSFSAAVLDLVMPGMGGLELAERIQTASTDTQVIILTGHGDLDSAIEGIQRGVFDYLRKDSLRIANLENSVARAVERGELLRQNRELVEKLNESNRRLGVLHELSASLAGQPHLDRLLARLVASVKDLCGAEAGRAILLEPTHDQGRVIAVAAGEGGEATRGARLQPGEGIATLVAEKGEPLLFSHPREHPRYSHRCDELPTQLPGWMAAPLRHGAVQGVVMVAGRQSAFGPEDRDLLSGLARQAAVALENASHRETMLNFFTHTCELLVSFLESLDVFYPGHSRRVAALADLASRRLGLGDEERRSVHFAALLHDIGKVRLDPAVLRSEGSASEEWRRSIEAHPALGLEMLRPIALWKEILPGVHAHHERWDGKGYPRGLAGEDIPLGARVVAVADAFDAMTRRRPHGQQRTPEQALAEIEACAGTQFDPRIARLFVAEYRQRGHQIPA